MARSYRNLVVWQKAKAFAVDLYRVTEAFPKHELYGLTSQPRRAGVSVASNIAEGQGRSTSVDFVRFLFNAKGSLLEIDTQLSIAVELQYLTEPEFRRLTSTGEEILILLNRLVDSLKRKQQASL
jgi:four helix bundle protein